MTQSGGNVYDFVARLALDPSQSQASILRQARSEGFRIGNDIARSLINSIRNRPTTRQARTLSNRFLSLTISTDPSTSETLRSLARNIGRESARLIEEQIKRTMIRITYTATGEVGFLWESNIADNQTTTQSVTNTVTVRADQIGRFNNQLPELGRALTQRIVDMGVTSLGLDSQYGDGILIGEIETTINSAQAIGP